MLLWHFPITNRIFANSLLVYILCKELQNKPQFDKCLLLLTKIGYL
ncbi:hypothetical protein D910_06036 [Dendroctonus ponderosae]|uniref:Uncharacterized protein n=1 Tax=Dendroctonus ponderosae TaxID=77166 RepID=U4U6E5_DENPD|nr:hypothetical protein D910_06036 [Dendroctonus ponderosae]